MRKLTHQSLDMVFPQLPPDQLIVVVPDRLPGGQPQLKLVHDNRREVSKLGDVSVARGTRRRIEDAQRAQVATIVGFERYPQIKLDAGHSRNRPGIAMNQGPSWRMQDAQRPGSRSI